MGEWRADEVGWVDEDVFGEQGVVGAAAQGRVGQSVSPISLPTRLSSRFHIPQPPHLAQDLE